MKRHHDMPDVVIPRLRLRILQRPRSDAQATPKRSSTTRKANPAAVSKVASSSRTTVAFGECPPLCCSSHPRPFPRQLDLITVCSSRFMLRMIATVAVSERPQLDDSDG